MPTLLWGNQKGLIALKKYSTESLAAELGRNAARQLWTGSAGGISIAFSPHFSETRPETLY